LLTTAGGFDVEAPPDVVVTSDPVVTATGTRAIDVLPDVESALPALSPFCSTLESWLQAEVLRVLDDPAVTGGPSTSVELELVLVLMLMLVLEAPDEPATETAAVALSVPSESVGVPSLAPSAEPGVGDGDTGTIISTEAEADPADTSSPGSFAPVRVPERSQRASRPSTPG
jgi:hypothetical protein